MILPATKSANIHNLLWTENGNGNLETVDNKSANFIIFRALNGDFEPYRSLLNVKLTKLFDDIRICYDPGLFNSDSE
jgi:hypothetical protein